MIRAGIGIEIGGVSKAGVSAELKEASTTIRYLLALIEWVYSNWW